MFNSIVQQLAHHAKHQHRSAHVHHSDVGDESGSVARTGHSTGSMAATDHVPDIAGPNSTVNTLRPACKGNQLELKV